MGLKEIKNPEISFDFRGKKWAAKFQLRNFAALRERYNISENDMLQGLIKGDIKKIPFAIWCSSLVFAPFDPNDPTKIVEEINIEELFELNLTELKEITDQVVKAMEAFLPQNPAAKAGATKKLKQTAKKKNS